MKRRWKLIVTIVVILAAVLAAATFFTNNARIAALSANPYNYIPVEKGYLADTISVNGIVESAGKSNVYSTLGFLVKSVNAETGDTVSEGQLLCELDTRDLELNIAQQRADMDASKKSADNQLENSSRILSDAVSSLDSGKNASIVNAENALRSASTNLSASQKNYSEKLAEHNDGTNAQILNAKSSLESAELDLTTKQANYESSKTLYEIGAISKVEFDNSENAHTLAVSRVEDAKTGLLNAERALDNELRQLKNTLDSAKVAYSNAESSLTAARESVQRELSQYESNVEGAKISVDNGSREIALQKLETQYEDAKIKAPANGTITAVYAKEGAVGSGLLFVIEDTNNLRISARIKEYDLARVKTGQTVNIRSDATGETVYEGVVEKIAPTSVKNSIGEAASTSDVEFEIKVAVTSEQTELKIGTNTRLSIILDERADTFFVPYDAVHIYEDGRASVFVMPQDSAAAPPSGVPPESGPAAPTEMLITVGMESDFYTEIIGEGLSESLMVVADARTVVEGQKDNSSGMGMGFMSRGG
jgi:multidrug resistance efflux pump